MPHVVASGLGKQYGRQWIVRHVALDLPPGTHLAITGANGSGKSTLLKLLAGAAHPTQGTVQYMLQGKPIPQESHFSYLSWAAPYVQPPLQLQLAELYRLHFAFRPCRLPSPEACLEALGLQAHSLKRLSELSSGLLQRTQLGLALFTDTPLLMLDEPTSFLDATTRDLMMALIRSHSQGRTLLLASNEPREYAHLSQRVLIQNGRLQPLEV
jgi:ABC-type multidrug transport system ATPase subunit